MVLSTTELLICMTWNYCYLQEHSYSSRVFQLVKQDRKTYTTTFQSSAVYNNIILEFSNLKNCSQIYFLKVLFRDFILKGGTSFWFSILKTYSLKWLSVSNFIFLSFHIDHFFRLIFRCLYQYSWSLNANVVIGKDDSCSPPKDELNVKDQWTLLLKDTNYSSYSVLALSPCCKIIAFGNLQGKIKLQDIGEENNLMPADFR